MILAAFTHLQSKDSLYARARGVHAAGLLDLETGKLLKVTEDIGRHNTIDKLHGACLMQDIHDGRPGIDNHWQDFFGDAPQGSVYGMSGDSIQNISNLCGS